MEISRKMWNRNFYGGHLVLCKLGWLFWWEHPDSERGDSYGHFDTTLALPWGGGARGTPWPTHYIFPRSQHTCLYIYIDQKWIYIKLYSASSRFEHCSNHSLNFLNVRINLLSFWMSEDHFRSHFWPFQINTKLFFNVFLKWPLLNAFLAISDRYETFFFLIFDKKTAVGHFECPRLTFYHISGQFRSIRIFFKNLFTKWLPAAILDVRRSLSITFLAIFRSIRSMAKWLPSAILDVRN